MKYLYSLIFSIVVISILLYFQRKNEGEIVLYGNLPKYAPYDKEDEQGFKGVVRSLYKKNVTVPNVSILNLLSYTIEMRKIGIDGVWVKYDQLKKQSFNQYKEDCRFLGDLYLPTPIALKESRVKIASLLSVSIETIAILIPNEGLRIYKCKDFLKNISGDIFLIENRPFLYKEN